MTEKSGLHVWKARQLWWRLAIVFVCVWGLGLGAQPLLFFTTQSNIIVLAYFAVAVWWMVVHRTTKAPAPRLRGGVTLWIVTTGLVAHLILNHGESPFPGLVDAAPGVAMANQALFLLHYAVPLMVLIDWALFGPRGTVRLRDQIVWILYPVIYGAAALLRGALFPDVSSRFNYPFFDFATLGFVGTVAALAQVLAIIAVLASGVVALDRTADFVARRLPVAHVDNSHRHRAIGVTLLA
ncbi:Pr6Pr family membrane protein [Microbacterium pumilum]|uniref:Integral membrane regulator n=1 Tax=Microbacterium pumilum TaxID=344165 RepID=A0ABP5E023_9MICO